MNRYNRMACSVADLHSGLRNCTPHPAEIPALKEAIAHEKAGQKRISVINLFESHIKRCAKVKEVSHGL